MKWLYREPTEEAR